eukprot:TRINITY_DN37313_c0_g3_i1.p1 TRINITY_DN37313_c0_g3~~TRINITY_DN37313_c0_g3_i1.p1  ORF type:complete len:200 (+),score=42.13 TRINITY_DN37313_c0_g3_i1:325-924(+)
MMQAMSGIEGAAGAARSGGGAESRAVRPRRNDLTELVAKLSLHSARIVRDLEGICVTTIILPADCPPMVQGKQAGKDYSEKAKSLGKEHGLGIPSWYVWCAVVSCLAMSTKDKCEKLKAHAEAVKEVKLLRGHVMHCKIAKTFKSTTVKFQFHVSEKLAPVAEEVIKILVDEHNGRYCDGPAPRGDLENRIQTALDEMR